VMGDRMGPARDDPLPWSELEGTDAVYLTAGDAGAVRAARGARALVATARAMGSLAEAGVRLDALVASAADAGERYAPGDIEPAPRMVVRTEGAEGGSIEEAGGQVARWQAAPLPGPAADTYGSGDAFAAGFTYGLGEGRSPGEAAALGARCGAAAATGAGPYAGQLRSAEDPA